MYGGTDNAGDEPAVAIRAQEVTAGQRVIDEFDPVFMRAIVYGRKPARPGVETVDVAGRGRWTFVFSTPQRLAAHYGDCSYFATTGADLLGQLPVGIGVMLDPDDEHRFPILNRVVPPQTLAVMRRRLAQKRKAAGSPAEAAGIERREGAG